MSEHYLAKEYSISKGVGVSNIGLPSFDKALINANVGNYNLVRLSSILPSECFGNKVAPEEIKNHIKEGSLLPTAYSTITSDTAGDHIVSSIGVGIPKDKNNVGIIMEYSDKNVEDKIVIERLKMMIKEAFEIRGWELESIEYTHVSADVVKEGKKTTTFACIAEW